VKGFPCAHLNSKFTSDQCIPAGVQIITSLDLSLLCMRREWYRKAKGPLYHGSQCPENLKPFSLGLNKHLEIDAPMIAEFPEKITHHEINEYIDGLQPYKLSVVSGQAVFRSCVDDQDLSADAMSYNISTVPGSSGSAITGINDNRELDGA
jgi:hypothetical protein